MILAPLSPLTVSMASLRPTFSNSLGVFDSTGAPKFRVFGTAQISFKSVVLCFGMRWPPSKRESFELPFTCSGYAKDSFPSCGKVVQNARRTLNTPWEKNTTQPVDVSHIDITPCPETQRETWLSRAIVEMFSTRQVLQASTTLFDHGGCVE
mmetsp:Transcript_7227/g.14861  ORF Transcript_7227/g.14861 Transcript_7227/m.14861 type:complete len:152 (+) Transcript_7227:3721-4176(+)